jgi:hypothetical protein
MKLDIIVLAVVALAHHILELHAHMLRGNEKRTTQPGTNYSLQCSVSSTANDD